LDSDDGSLPPPLLPQKRFEEDNNSMIENRDQKSVHKAMMEEMLTMVYYDTK
jgi:hypothetical protein